VAEATALPFLWDSFPRGGTEGRVGKRLTPASVGFFLGGPAGTKGGCGGDKGESRGRAVEDSAGEASRGDERQFLVEGFRKTLAPVRFSVFQGRACSCQFRNPSLGNDRWPTLRGFRS
jgi:hypothetical protein